MNIVATRPTGRPRARGSVLIIVLWVALGLVSIALYFAHTMSFELRAADNRVASVEAEMAILGAARYVSNLLATAEVPGQLPDLQSYESEDVPVGDAAFWLLGRDPRQTAPEEPWFELGDEASKLNLNTATADMLEMLPGMTPELAAAIVDWRDTDTTASSGGAEGDVYQRLSIPYRCKDTNYESAEELRLVYGMDLELLYGEDANLNGVLDPNENDGDLSAPYDNRDGRLDPGLLEYVTVFSREPNTRTNGEPRVNVSGTNVTQLASLLQERFGTQRANEILARVTGPGGGGGPPGGGGAANLRSLLEFYIRSGMTAEEFGQVEKDLTVSTGNAIEGLVNVNTASEAVLACLPGIGAEQAPALVAYRQSNASTVSSLAWVAEVLDRTNAFQAGPYLSASSYQFTADVAAVGHHGRGYQRVKFVFDTSDGSPRILYRQDLAHLGWALGKDVRQTLQLARDTR